MYVPIDQALTAALASIGANATTSLNLKRGRNSFELVATGSVAWHLKVTFELPLTVLPSIFLAAPAEGEGLAHVSYTGCICYSDHEGEGFDPTNVENVVAFAVARAVAVLEDSLRKKQAGDFQALLDEFEGYWHSIPDCYMVPLASAPVAENQLYAQVQQIHSKRARILALDQGIGIDAKTPRRKVHFFPIASAVMPPVNGELLQNGWLQNLIDQAGPVAQHISKQHGSHIFLFAQARTEGESLFGVMFTTVRSGSHAKLTRVHPFGVQRAWRDYLLARTGVSQVKQCVAIIGCGALGSRVAEQLAISGIDELILIDFDYFSYDNIYRHILGRNSVGQRKVYALKHELEIKHPGLLVHTFTGTAEQWLCDPARRQVCQTIVLTTGQLAMEREITQQAFAECWSQRLVSGWLEPLGLGGHVIASKAGVSGCLECLFTDVGCSRPDMRVAFLTPGQQVSRNLTGCGGRFMPYSALHATETALLVCKMVLAGTTGYRCWAGDPAAAIAEGLSVTRWHERCRNLPPNEPVAHRDCPCCSS